MQCSPFPVDVIVKFTQAEALQLATYSTELSSHISIEEQAYQHEDFEAKAHMLQGPSFDRIRQFAERGNDYGTLVLQGVPNDPFLPATPKDGRRPSGKVAVTEAASALIGCLLGDVFSYADEKDGLLVQNICPVEGQEQKQENTGSVFLEYHTEDSFHPLPPDILMLTCLRTDRTNKALTATACITRVLDNLAPDIIDILRQPQFTWSRHAKIPHEESSRQSMV